MAAATDTFIESKVPSMGILIFDFDSFVQNALNPVASVPTTTAAGVEKSIFS